MSQLSLSVERRLALARGLWPGFLTAATIAMAAVFVSNHYGGPTLLYAMLLGIAFNFLSQEPRTPSSGDRVPGTVTEIQQRALHEVLKLWLLSPEFPAVVHVSRSPVCFFRRGVELRRG